MDTQKWVKFFIDAGVLSSYATEYAILFNEHRIKQDMLLDLSKEYLNDMGIKTLGDVIAILKHAKITHGKIAKDKVIEEMSPTPRSSIPSKKVIHLKKKLEPHTITLTEAKKRRRVLPHEEGGYKVIMPQGTTPKTKKILEQQRKLNAPAATSKKSVFNRLGEGIVSSTSDLLGTKSSESVFNRLDRNSTNSSLSLPYQGILKTNISIAKSNRISSNYHAEPTNNVRTRLGPLKGSYEISSTTLASNNYSSLQLSKSINMIRTDSLSNRRQRLGITNPYTIPREAKSVFDRLGE